VNYILNKKIKHYIRQTQKIAGIIITGMLIIVGIIFIKYKPIYEVKFEGENLGYIQNKKNFSYQVEQIIEKKGENILFVSLDNKPEYELKFVNKDQSTNEEVVLAEIENSAIITYVRYAITLNGENKGYAKTQEEAEKMVEEIKSKFADKLELNIAVVKEYTENLEEIDTANVELAKNQLDETLTKAVKEEEKKKKSTINGVLLASKPVSGIVSSRFGATNGRDHSHKGIDIAAPTGTPIYACGEGTVTKAGWSNGYGYLVVISHGNGVETYYGHCSKLFVTTGQKVSSGAKIANVGSTGRSTGPHLHLEIRKNGVQINPQTIFYK